MAAMSPMHFYNHRTGGYIYISPPLYRNAVGPLLGGALTEVFSFPQSTFLVAEILFTEVRVYV